jgi:hypothetical protein
VSDVGRDICGFQLFFIVFLSPSIQIGARDSVVDCGTTSRKVAGSIPDEVTGFFN